MGHAMSIDTLAIVKKLEASGLEANQAEGITEAIKNFFDNLQENVATKQEIDLTENSAKQEISLLRREIEKLSPEFDNKLSKLSLEFDSKLSKTKAEIIMWVVGSLVGLLFAQTAIVLSIIKFIVH